MARWTHTVLTFCFQNPQILLPPKQNTFPKSPTSHINPKSHNYIHTTWWHKKDLKCTELGINCTSWQWSVGLQNVLSQFSLWFIPQKPKWSFLCFCKIESSGRKAQTLVTRIRQNNAQGTTRSKVNVKFNYPANVCTAGNLTTVWTPRSNSQVHSQNDHNKKHEQNDHEGIWRNKPEQPPSYSEHGFLFFWCRRGVWLFLCFFGWILTHHNPPPSATQDPSLYSIQLQNKRQEFILQAESNCKVWNLPNESTRARQPTSFCGRRVGSAQ